jgi:hypothetical protein
MEGKCYAEIESISFDDAVVGERNGISFRMVHICDLLGGIFVILKRNEWFSQRISR